MSWILLKYDKYFSFFMWLKSDETFISIETKDMFVDSEMEGNTCFVTYISTFTNTEYLEEAWTNASAVLSILTV